MKPGFPVIDAQGLVGRLLETGSRVARVLLLTDLNSRIPIEIGRLGVRGIMVGDNGVTPRIEHLPADALIAVGDDVSTSGVGGIFPRGLRIGTVTDDGTSFRVAPRARFDELDYVSVLLYESPSLEAAAGDKSGRNRDAVSRRVGSSRPTAEQGMSVP